MSESPHDPIDRDAVDGAADERSDATQSVVETGHPAVDEVLRSLGRLDELPVSEHVAVYEDAHDALRRALSDARDGEPEGAPGDPEA